MANEQTPPSPGLMLARVQTRLAPWTDGPSADRPADAAYVLPILDEAIQHLENSRNRHDARILAFLVTCLAGNPEDTRRRLVEIWEDANGEAQAAGTQKEKELLCKAVRQSFPEDESLIHTAETFRDSPKCWNANPEAPGKSQWLIYLERLVEKSENGK